MNRSNCGTPSPCILLDLPLGYDFGTCSSPASGQTSPSRHHTHVTEEEARSRNFPTPERNTLGFPSSLSLGLFWFFSSSCSAFLFSASTRLSSSSC
ncbi:hypothetical protein E2C01_016344 [Portunus trituberculatus]|uniref:Uncharacterized protein n=1 Tax=Portunus trituberculatus TaxID=210409 RepID=A0A5B7DP54_PORTR|nr:hypothetical protein [Portunus trituberculatus]